MIDPATFLEVVFVGVPIVAEMIIGFLDLCAFSVEQHQVMCETVLAASDPVLWFREVL